jgi:hypothetical protein
MPILTNRRYSLASSAPISDGTMIADDDKPIGAPVLPESRRDRLSVWVAEHRWAVLVIRLAGGLILVIVVALVFRTDFAWGTVIAFVVGAVLGGRVGETEKERGDTLLGASESLPREFGDHFPPPPATGSEGRYARPRHM